MKGRGNTLGQFMGPLWAAFVCVWLCGGPLGAAVTATAVTIDEINPADQQRLQQEQQAEALDTLDTTSTTTFMAAGSPALKNVSPRGSVILPPSETGPGNHQAIR